MPSGPRQLVRRAFLCAALGSMAIPAVAQASLQFSPNVTTQVAFGSTTVMNSSEQTLTLTNTSTTASENITGMQITGPEASQFGVGPTFCPPTLGPGASCNFNVRFNPSHAGVINAAQLQVNNNPNPPLTRQLNGMGVAANLSPSATTMDFETVLVDDGGESKSINVLNMGSAPTQVNQIDITGPDASAFRLEGNCMGPNLAPGQSCAVSVRFDPHDPRVHNATLHIRAGGSDFPVALTGLGGVAEIVLAPDPLDFGNVAVGSSVTKTITGRSVGNAPFQAFVAVVAGGDVGDMRIVRDMCSVRLLFPTQQCTVTVRFSPSAVGPAEAGLAVIGEDRPNIAMLRGNGVAAAGPPAPPARRKARVVFKRKRGPARIKHGRVKLGRATCEGTPSCSATVRSRFMVKVPGARRPYLVQGRSQKWTLPRKRPVSIPVPAGVQGTLSRVIVTVRASAPGFATGTQRKVLSLMPVKAPRRPRPPA
jgi:hypothetical protein